MAFDSLRGPEWEPFEPEPIDWADWARAILVFGAFLILYLVWFGAALIRLGQALWALAVR